MKRYPHGLPNTGHFSFARPAQPGDYCLLLVPAENPSQEQLHLYQQNLQSAFGGRIPVPTHLTCNRFETPSNIKIRKLIQELQTRSWDMPEFPILGNAYLPQYSPFRNINILKWEIEPDEHLQKAHTLIERALATAGVESLYPIGWISTLVTALEDISTFSPQLITPALALPNPLFIAGQIVLTLIKKPTEFETVARINLPPLT